MAMVIQANREHAGLGGHIASFASSATLYDVGFNHFFHAPSESHGGDLVFIQGHSAPGIYARAFIEGRIEEDDLRRFRQETLGPGLSSYPHPWLMPDLAVPHGVDGAYAHHGDLSGALHALPR
jgi:pyruvate dehydrogenase E1 component